MDLTIYPRKLSGTLTAIPSKSQAHRFLICAAFSDQPTKIICPATNQDIEATVSCLNALGSVITRASDGYFVIPVQKIPTNAEMDCCESGSTLRFLLPIVCALGVSSTIHMSGRLPQRPLSPLWEELERMGAKLTRTSEDTIQTSGKLRNGIYTIAGNISSQFISGLLFALSLLDGESTLNIEGTIESEPYIAMTQYALSAFGVNTSNFQICGSAPFHSQKEVCIEGDWSNSAFFLAAKALGQDVCVLNLNPKSLQGDRAIADILLQKQNMPCISAANIPDLIPILAVFFASQSGAVFTDIGRLRLKESDRVSSVMQLLHSLGIHSEADETTMRVYPGTFSGGTVNTFGDHRIAMSAAVAATLAQNPVNILDAECVSKSYPSFWQEYQRLGGKYEQYIR